MKYREWEEAVPGEIKGDLVGKIEAFRLARFLAELSWNDVTRLVGDKRTMGLADQLYCAAGAVNADIEEGYSQSSEKDRARFYEYALSSARETRGWHFKARHILGTLASSHRLSLMTQIFKLLLKMVPIPQGQILNEETAVYISSDSEVIAHSGPVRDLLEPVPLP